MMKTKLVYLFAIGVLLLNSACTTSPDKNGKAGAADNEKSNQSMNSGLYKDLLTYITGIEDSFTKISDERKEELQELAHYIKSKTNTTDSSNLIFICTHNSRRSHMSQLWAQAAAFYYGKENIFCFSGGTEATAFNPRSVRALRKAGFRIEQTDSTSNPIYLVKFSDTEAPVKAFSKKYDDTFNPQKNFAAIMTCSHADESCPMVNGAEFRVAIPYDDPKIADNTPEEEVKYDERCRQIATEMFYIFSLI